MKKKKAIKIRKVDADNLVMANKDEVNKVFKNIFDLNTKGSKNK